MTGSFRNDARVGVALSTQMGPQEPPGGLAFLMEVPRSSNFSEKK